MNLRNIGSILKVKHCGWFPDGKIRFPLFWSFNQSKLQEKPNNYEKLYFWRKGKKLLVFKLFCFLKMKATRAYWTLQNSNCNERKNFLENVAHNLGYELWNDFHFIQIEDLHHYGGSKFLSNQNFFHSFLMEHYPPYH